MSEPVEAHLEGCIRFEARAQKALYERLAPKMLAVCARYARSTFDAEDILQDGFIKVFQKIGDFSGKGSLEGWVRRIMVRTAIDHYRKTKKQDKEVDIDEQFTDELSAEMVDQLSVDYLLSLIQTLPSGYRIVFNLFAIEGYSHKEIAQQLAINESTSRSQYTRARALLKKRISEDNQHKSIFRDVI
ncbi:MAG: RNA polymerase sigma factor [Bacteroidota bacterium]